MAVIGCFWHTSAVTSEGFRPGPGISPTSSLRPPALRGGPAWLACGGLAAASGFSISIGDFGADYRRVAKVLAQVLALTALCVITGLSWWVALAWVGCVPLLKNGARNKSASLVCVGWATMSALTPIYHPYSRLWLPLEALGCLLFGGLFVEIRSRIDDWRSGARWTWNYASNPLSWFALAALIGAILSAIPRARPGSCDTWACWPRATLCDLHHGRF